MTVYVEDFAPEPGTPGNTDAVPEGVGNLYHTSARVNALITAAVGVSIQAYNATLATLSGLATQVFGLDLLNMASAAALRTTIALPISTTAGRLARYTDAAGSQSQTTGLYEDASGNVGIGTTSPGTRFHVAHTGTAVEVGDGTGTATFIGFAGTRIKLGFDGSGASVHGLSKTVALTNNAGVGVVLTTTSSVGLGGPIGNASDLTGAKMVVLNNGKVGIGTNSPTSQLDNAGDTYRQRASRTPASSSAAGNAGEVCWDANYVYVCVATNVWKRSALETW